MLKKKLAIIIEYANGKVEIHETRDLDFIANLSKTGKLLSPKLQQFVKAAIVSQFKAFKLLPFR